MIQPGDLVRRKTGGRLMTVTESLGDRGFRCQWFDGFDPRSAVYPEAILEKAYTRPRLVGERGPKGLTALGPASESARCDYRALCQLQARVGRVDAREQSILTARVTCRRCPA
jgi:uncharacterized protein YodC (DUF2158 family)